MGSGQRKALSQISSSGYVLSTLEASLWSVGHTEGFEEAALLAANLGDDADTVVVVTGQLAVALYGPSAIPQLWIERLAWHKLIEARTDELLAIAGSRKDTATASPRVSRRGRGCPGLDPRRPCW
jgi:ADP-ribosyl-[dinitrogen reductase] hydrolase